jgi:hypothetical protein
MASLWKPMKKKLLKSEKLKNTVQGNIRKRKEDNNFRFENEPVLS